MAHLHRHAGLDAQLQAAPGCVGLPTRQQVPLNVQDGVACPRLAAPRRRGRCDAWRQQQLLVLLEKGRGGGGGVSSVALLSEVVGKKVPVLVLVVQQACTTACRIAAAVAAASDATGRQQQHATVACRARRKSVRSL